MIVVMFSSGIVFLLVGAAYMSYDYKSYRSTMVQDLMILTDVIASNSTAALAFNDYKDARKTLSALKVQEHMVASCIYDRHGKQFAKYKSDPDVPVPDLLPSLPNGFSFGDNRLEMIRPINLDGEKIGDVYVHINLLQLRSRMRGVITAMAIMIFIAFGLVFAIVAGLQRVISVPILKLAGIARLVSAEKDYSVRVAEQSKDEVGSLVKAFNDMLEQIQFRDQKLLKAHDELEDRVQERTRELKAEMAENERARKQISESLKEKETLLKEIHHRVKNNLQVISSLLYLQSKKIGDKESLDIFTDSQLRVKSMALIHENLYQSDNLSQIDIREYIGKLINYYLQSYRDKTKYISIKSDVEPIKLGVDIAVPCGLIVNELVSNCLKHAFEDMQEGLIEISVKWNIDNDIVLSVSDNGRGISEQIDFKNGSSLGLQLIDNLVRQLNGNILVTNNKGTRIDIVFDANIYSKGGFTKCAEKIY